MKKHIILFLSLIFLISLSSCSSSQKTSGTVFKKKAIASYYHNKFNGRKTASGERFSNNKLTAAHRKLTFGTKVRVTNLVNDKSVIVLINDRGPFTRGREIDLSKRAFMDITDNKNHGVLSVKIEILK